MLLKRCELIFKVDWYVTLKRDGLGPRLSNVSGWELDLTRELGCVHYWVGVYRNEKIVVSLCVCVCQMHAFYTCVHVHA